MRKRMMKKKRSCPICKPHKMGIVNKYKSKELDKLEQSEKIIEEEYKGFKCDARAMGDYESYGGSDY